MSRPLRIEYPVAWYHVACRGNQRLKIFGAKEYETKPEEILRARSKWREARQVLIELSYQLNFQIKSLHKLGEELGGIGGDSIAHTHQRIQNKMKKDKRLSRRVNRIYQEVISH